MLPIRRARLRVASDVVAAGGSVVFIKQVHARRDCVKSTLPLFAARLLSVVLCKAHSPADSDAIPWQQLDFAALHCPAHAWTVALRRAKSRLPAQGEPRIAATGPSRRVKSASTVIGNVCRFMLCIAVLPR